MTKCVECKIWSHKFNTFLLNYSQVLHGLTYDGMLKT